MYFCSINHFPMNPIDIMTKTDEAIEKERQFGAHNYKPIPVVLERGEGVYVWDVEGKRYYDFLSAYSAVNLGHNHPKVVAALTEQAKKLSLTSRAFYTNALGEYEEYVTKLFGYDKVLPMNTGAEGVETAIKLCRKWAYQKKGIAADKAKIIVCEGNFHGRTTTIISMSTDPDARNEFGPYTPGFVTIPCIKTGEHDSTYGSNPVAFKVAIGALDVLQNENMSANAESLGKILLAELKSIRHPKIKTVRGKGLFCAMVIDDSIGKNVWDLCLALKENGLLAKPTHGDIIRFAPPLIITEEQLKECIGIIKHTLSQF